MAPEVIEESGGRGDLSPTVACFCATFLPAEALHVYRQIAALRRWQPVVLTQKLAHADSFPFPADRLSVIPRSPWRPLRRIWFQQWLRAPVPLSRGEGRRLVGELSRREVRVLHVYFGHDAARVLPSLGEWDGPVVVSFHGADAGMQMGRPAHRRAIGEVFQRADLVLARSRALLTDLAALGCPESRLRLHRTGIPLGEFHFQARTYPPPEGRWRLLQACRLIGKKGLPTTLRAFAEFGKDYPNATLTIAGEGPMRGELEELAAALNITARVKLTGFLSQEHLGERFADAHLFLHPSETGVDGNREGVPNSLLEAMATGLPVVATTHGGIPEAVTDGESGRLVPEHDPGALAAALRGMVADPARLARMGENASISVAREFGQTAQVARLETLYDEAVSLRVSDRRPPRRP